MRVLIVDDQEAFRSAARMVVEMTDGFETVGEAADGLAAIDLTTTLAPQLILMDVRLPGIDGIEATRRIIDRHPEVRVLVLSTYDEYAAAAVAAGAVRFITKSAFGPDAILTAWREPYGRPRHPRR